MLARLPPELRGRPRIGFAYDDPRVTPPARVRHDSTVEVDDAFALTDALADDGFELLESPAGLWAMIDVPAPNSADGYRAINDGWFQACRGYAMRGDPFLERQTVAPDGEVVITVCVCVRPLGQEGDWNMAVLEPGAALPPVPR